MSKKKWSVLTLSILAAILLSIGIMVIIVDPFFHYHAPANGLKYPFDNQRYINDGIIKRFDYDAIITGTSMTENFKASEFDMLFNAKSVKIPFSGASYKEIDTTIQRAVTSNPDIKYVVRGLDYNDLLDDKDRMRTDAAYPSYLYDDNVFNDVSYIYNMDVLMATLKVIYNTFSGGETTTFDEYSSWDTNIPYGKDAVDALYKRPEKSGETEALSEDELIMLQENLEQNVIKTAIENPQITFYLFLTPYSIYYWDSLYQTGTLEKQLAIEKAAIEMLLKYDNIYLFSFHDEFSVICNLDNYMDTGHYGPHINSMILNAMANKEHLLTKDNYMDYFNSIYDFYTKYDYDSLF